MPYMTRLFWFDKTTLVRYVSESEFLYDPSFLDGGEERAEDVTKVVA